MKKSKLVVPPSIALPESPELQPQELTTDQLLALLEAKHEGGIRITFAGKHNARGLARAVRPRVCRSIAKLSEGPPEERANNWIVEGDNLQAMATLYKQRGHVDLILADPPYNTGKDFRYNDRWEEDPNDPGLGEVVSADDGAKHTKWMRFMWPRLQMMKQMLKPSGVLAICIDYRELFRLGQMLDELFGDHNRIAIINWERAATRRNDAEHVSTSTEYVLVYAKDKQKARTERLERSSEQNESYSNPDNDQKNDWYGISPFAAGDTTHPGMVYGIQSPFTGALHYPPSGAHWKYEKASIKDWLEDWGTSYEERELHDGRPPALLLKGAKDPRELPNPLEDPAVAKANRRAIARRERGNWPALIFTKSGLGKPRKKLYLQEVKKGLVPATYWADDESLGFPDLESTSWDSTQSGTSETGARELTAIVGSGHGFETVKPLKLFQKIVQIWCPHNGLVLDPFAGSGTTGHAILALNATGGASRRFVLIEQGRPENGDSYARTLLAERLRRVVAGKWANGKGKALGGGFSFVSLDKKVDADALLRMEREEMVDTVIASHFDATRRRGDQLVRIDGSRGRNVYKYLVAKNSDNEGFFLVWSGARGNTDFTESVYEICAQEAAHAGLSSTCYHVYARLYRYQTDGIRFYQIPDRILADFGLDLRSEPFSEELN